MRARLVIACTILTLSVGLLPGRGMCSSLPTIDVCMENILIHSGSEADGSEETRILYSWKTTNCDHVTIMGYNNTPLNPSGQIKLLPGSYIFVAHGSDMKIAMQPVGIDRSRLPLEVGAADDSSTRPPVDSSAGSPLVKRFEARKLTAGWHREAINTKLPLGDLEQAVVNVLQRMGYLVNSDVLSSCVFAYTPQPTGPRGKKGKPILAQAWWQRVRDPVDRRATIAVGVEGCGYASTKKTHNVYISASVETMHLRKTKVWLPDPGSAPHLCAYIGNWIAEEVKK